MAEIDIIIRIIGTLSIGYTLYYSRRIILLKPQHLLIYKVQAIKRAYRLGQDRKVIINRIVNKDIILKAILSNKTALYKFITSVI